MLINSHKVFHNLRKIKVDKSRKNSNDLAFLGPVLRQINHCKGTHRRHSFVSRCDLRNSCYADVLKNTLVLGMPLTGKRSTFHVLVKELKVIKVGFESFAIVAYSAD